MGATELKLQLALPRSHARLTLPAAPRIPLPVRRYLRFANLCERTPVTAARILFRGWSKSERNGKSRFMHSVLELTSIPWSRSRTGDDKFLGGWMRVRDTYREGQGRMRLDLLSAFAIMNVSSPERAV